ncbi:c-type cytochrome [Tardiphaga robiniae]|uniref:Cytochrome C n=1 Tax=Tardiphaga robiniae TaxID=943830 RepID=A0A7G6U0U4_9BRAD|nr:cytochrome C [Tardiphaga robiniae]QND72626.1 cytochrome C [Tardiphaga robiniae]
MKTFCTSLAIGLIVTSAAPVRAASSAPPPGAASCSGCHAATSQAIPNIYGRDADATRSTLLAFRNGSMPATVMTRIAKGFSEDEIGSIAAWLATQK